MPYDDTDEQMDRKARQLAEQEAKREAAARRRATFVRALRNVVHDCAEPGQGRLVLQGILEECLLWKEISEGGPGASEKMGKRNLGLMIRREIKDVSDASMLAKMEREYDLLGAHDAEKVLRYWRGDDEEVADAPGQ